ncbi:MAG: hypothetical protein COT90_03270 [Candidatus Diapherotrites archaeon CG10_big_fil_rev_8_21_14_0_10_31_34]|nr:MAG: hypothetical protein COT90_03270 [Candidatus Diapherotrites archaeon CG10_big_fil_rev_8_21_14_0_10_31_34]
MKKIILDLKKNFIPFFKCYSGKGLLLGIIISLFSVFTFFEVLLGAEIPTLALPFMLLAFPVFLFA